MTIFVKDPAAELAYAVDWGAEYLAGQSILSSSWSVSPDDAGAMSIVAPLLDGGRASVTLAGGRPGYVYRITNSVIFSDGGRDERSLVVRVEDR